MKLRSFIVILLGLIALFTLFKRSLPEDAQATAQHILDAADIKINGQRSWDITVHNPALYARVLRDGSLGLGEAYMEGWWDCSALDEFFFKLLRSETGGQVGLNWRLMWDFMKAKLINLQSRSRSTQVGKRHYDLGNDLFKAMLDNRMIYSCAYWPKARSLDQAQEKKLDLICKKLDLKPGMKVLDIGCGWGGFARYAAEKYGVEVVGITISKEQVAHGQDYCKDLPVAIRMQDYRNLNEIYDRIVSVGMFEHVGTDNYKTFMDIAARCLKDDGLFLLHTIGGNSSTTIPDAWINTYIFPNGMLPSMKQITEAAEGTFIIEDWHNFGPDYDKTLMAWFDRFDKSWPMLKSHYDERFYRMWKYYLLSCAGLFRARGAQLWQIVLSKKGKLGGYLPVR